MGTFALIPAVSYKRRRFPPEIIAHVVSLYLRFPLSLRLVEEMLLERGFLASYETVRRWALTFVPAYARRLRRKTPSPRDIWHLDEVVTIAGQKHWLLRAVDQDRYVLDEIVQTRRDTKAAKRLLRCLLKQQGSPPRRLITDKLASTLPPTVRSCPRWSTARATGLTKERRIGICRCVGERGRCRALNR